MNLLLPRAVALLAGEDAEACDIRIREGRIHAIRPAGSLQKEDSEELLDTEGHLVLPGVIDGHVHFDDPGYTWRERFDTGTQAAAAGGVTMVVDMPCTSLPPVTCREHFEKKHLAIRERACVDYMFWGGLCGNMMDEDPNWEDRLAELADAGVAGMKSYLLSGMDSFRELDEDRLEQAATACHRLGLPLAVHAEDRATVESLQAELSGKSLQEVDLYCESRPAEAELEAARMLLRITARTGARIHIVHLGTGAVLDLLAEAGTHASRLSAESAPHYMSFSKKDFEQLGSRLKTAPVVKSETDRKRLWLGLEKGELLFLATDHAAGKWPEEKQTGSFLKDYGGVPGVELLLPWLYSEGVAKGRISLGRLGKVLGSAPAEFFGVSHRKGSLREGADADFILFDPAAQWRVKASGLHNLNRYTPFEGWKLQGRVEQTWLGGRKVYHRLAENEYPAGFTGELIKRGHAHV